MAAGAEARWERQLRCALAQVLDLEQGDAAPPGLDPAQLAQRAQRADDRLARRPVQPASSSWVIASSMCDAVALGLPEAVGQLDEARAHAADGVLSEVLDALAVGVAQAPGEHAREHEGDARRGVQEETKASLETR